VTFPETESSSPAATTRMKRQLAEQAIASAASGNWSDAADTNRKLLELGADAESENRLAKALWELGELGAAREHYQAALALDPTNRIAERNIDRLRTLLVAAGEKTVAAQDGSKAPVRIFVEETGKTGFAHLIELPDAKKLAQVNPGDSVELQPEGNRLIAISNGMRIGVVEPRVAARLLKLIADGNKYLAGVTRSGRRTSGSSSARSTRTPATTARSASRPRPSPPTSARTPRAPSSARTRSSRRTSRTTSRTRRSPTSTASSRRRTRPTRHSSRRRTSSRSSSPSGRASRQSLGRSSHPRSAARGRAGSWAVRRRCRPSQSWVGYFATLHPGQLIASLTTVGSVAPADSCSGPGRIARLMGAAASPRPVFSRYVAAGESSGIFPA
jgi:hypothetical protein